MPTTPRDDRPARNAIFLSKIYFAVSLSNTFARTDGVHSFKSKEGKKSRLFNFQIGTDGQIVLLKQTELFSDFPYPLPPQQITLFFILPLLIG